MVSFIPGLPAEGSPLVSAEIRNNFIALNNRTDKVEVKATTPASASLLISSGIVFFQNKVLIEFAGQKLNLGDPVNGIAGFKSKGYFKDVAIVLRLSLNHSTNTYEATVTFVEGPEKEASTANFNLILLRSNDLPLAHFVVRHNGVVLDAPGQIEPISQSQIIDTRNYLDVGGVEYYSAVVGDRQVLKDAYGSIVVDGYFNPIITGTTTGTFVSGDSANFHPIQSAVSQLESTGGTILLRRGVYEITSTITIPNNITLLGEGASTIIKMLDTFEGPMFRILGDRVSINNIVFQGTLPSYINANDALIKLVNSQYCTIKDCYIQGGVIGISLSNSNYNIVTNNYFISNDTAISILNCQNNFITYNQFNSNSTEVDDLGSNLKIP